MPALGVPVQLHPLVLGQQAVLQADSRPNTPALKGHGISLLGRTVSPAFAPLNGNFPRARTKGCRSQPITTGQ
eukprot:1624406-Rhodomonas_salina.1